MAFERQAVAAMSNPEAARAWLEASRKDEAAFLNLCAVLAACEENDNLHIEAENLAKHIAHLNSILNGARRNYQALCIFSAFVICGQLIALWGALLAVLK